jgi:hypothetical protein
VYDSLQPPPRPSTDDACDASSSSSSSSSGAEAVAARQACAYADSLPAWYAPRGPADDTLVFESRFESGNLRRAVQVAPYEYDLVLQPDLNTRGHTQWFFLAVSNTRAGRPYRLNIINLLKPDSLYNAGMLPLLHSQRQMAEKVRRRQRRQRRQQSCILHASCLHCWAQP